MKETHILELLSRAERSESQVSFVTPRGMEKTSFSELWTMAGRAARAIVSPTGSQSAPYSVPNGRIAGVLTPSTNMVACFVGSLRAGRDFVSLPLPGRGQDVASYVGQIHTILTLADVGAVVVEAVYAEALATIWEAIGCRLVVAESLVQAGGSWRLRDVDPGEVIQFSSGTTGVPKGVRLSGTAIAANVGATLDALGVFEEPEAFCGWLPLSHDMGLIGGLLGSWSWSTRTKPGYRYTCISPELFIARPMLWMETCAAAGATVTAGPTFAYHLMSRYLARASPLDLRRMRICLIGAEHISADTMRGFAAAAGRHGLHELALCPAYGLAEASLAVTLVAPGQPWSSQAVSVDGVKREVVSCGRALTCVDVDAPEAGRANEGEPAMLVAGPIRVRGPAVSSGYIPRRDGASDGWVDTGDLGVLSAGELFVTGRLDDLICIGGRNVFAWELEGAASTVPRVRSGNCVVVPDGQGRYVVLFEVRARTGTGDSTDDSLSDVLLEVRKRVAAAAGIGPSNVACVPAGSLPKTASGKLQRNRVAGRLDAFLESSIVFREF